MQLYQLPPPPTPISPYNPSTPLPRQSCQTFVYVIILIVLLISHDCLGDGRQKRAPGQATKRSIDAHLARLDRTHRPASNALSPASGVPTWPAWVPPGPLVTTRPPRLGCAEGQTHTRTSIHICGLFKDRNTMIISFTRVISNLFNIRFFKCLVYNTLNISCYI